MATPDRVMLVCPLCGSTFRARTMGSSYYISGLDTDLRETGSIEEVRRFSVASCQVCRYSDYSWDFLAPEELDPEQRQRLEEALGVDASHPGPALNRTLPDFERLHLAGRCFVARGLDRSAQAELALLAYYVAQDLGRRDLAPGLRNEAATLLATVLEEEGEELPTPLRARYAYLTGELNRRSGRRDEAVRAFHQAIAASDAEEAEAEGGGDIGRLARRMLTRVDYHDARPTALLELARGDDPDAASEACRLLASRRDRASVDATREAWPTASAQDRTEMLRELVLDPSPALFDLFVEALESPAPEDIRLAAQALGGLADPRAAAPLIAALERGILSTEAALIEALRRSRAPGAIDEVARILERWEAEREAGADDAWFFSNDTTPLKHLLYTSDDPRGLELLIRDMQRLDENDLWDKVPAGGPVSAALSLPPEAVALALRGLLTAHSAATRRWAAYCLAELGQADAVPAIAALVGDPDPVVRLQAASALARLGDASHEAVVLSELEALDPSDLPFALHFLVPFRSPRVKRFLLRALEQGHASKSEVLPLIGRQEGDPELTNLLVSSLLDTDDETRAGAVTGLAYQGGAEAAERLRLLYDQEDSEEVLRRVIHGLGQLAARGVHTAEIVTFLRERLNKANPRLRFSVALTLLNLDDPTGIDIVRERAALFDQSFDRYDLVAPALKALAGYEARRAKDAAAAG